MIVAAVPIKRPEEAKSRLAGELSPKERAELALMMLEHVIDALRAANGVGRIALVTPEPELGARFDLDTVPDAGSLNVSLERAVEWAMQQKADGLLIVPADLPLMRQDDIVTLVSAALPPPSIVIAPTRGGGTGALLLHPPNAIPPCFGENSYERHRELAREHGVTVSQVHAPGLAFDLDTPEDLAELLA